MQEILARVSDLDIPSSLKERFAKEKYANGSILVCNLLCLGFAGIKKNREERKGGKLIFMSALK